MTARPAVFLLALAACAAPAPKPAPPAVALRVCVQDESLVEAYAKYFAKAVAADPREGRECDFTARAPSLLNAGKVTLRSAYDGAVLTEIEGPAEMVPQLAALSLGPDTETFARLMAQRKASGFGR